MNKLNITLLLAVTSLALVAVGCGDSTMDVDMGTTGHPDLGLRDTGTDTGTVVDLGADTGTVVDMGMIDAGMVDSGMIDSGPVDGGAGHYTEAGCYEGTPVIMTDFLNHCVDPARETPASGVTGTGTRSTLIYPDGGVPPIP